MNLDKQDTTPSEPNLSTSLLTIPSFLIHPTPQTQSIPPPIHKILPAFHDPIFHTFTIHIPQTISHLLPASLPFTYKLVPQNRFEIIQDNKIISFHDLFRYGDELLCESNLIFVIERRKYQKMKKQAELKNYKKCITAQIKFMKDMEQSEYEEGIKLVQVRDGKNMIFVENFDDLLRGLKAVVKSYGGRRCYYRKGKSFKCPNEYLKYVIGQVPGIGGSVGMSIANKFHSVYDFYKFVSEKEELEECEIYNLDKTCCRKLGSKQANIIRKIFMGRNRDELI